METKEVFGVVLSSYQDKVIGYTYLHILTNNGLESFRLTQSLDKSNFANYLGPNYYLNFEVVKTSKNWIFKDIINSKLLWQSSKWSDYQWLTEVVKLFIYYSKDTHPNAKLLDFYKYLLSLDKKLAVDLVEKKLLEISGFSVFNNANKTILEIKNDSGII